MGLLWVDQAPFLKDPAVEGCGKDRLWPHPFTCEASTRANRSVSWKVSHIWSLRNRNIRKKPIAFSNG